MSRAIPSALQDKIYNDIRKYLKDEDCSHLDAIIAVCNAYSILIMYIAANHNVQDAVGDIVTRFGESNPNIGKLLLFAERLACLVRIFEGDLDANQS